MAAGLGAGRGSGRRRVLFVLNDDFGSLSEALYFVHDQPLEATLLAPPRLYALNRHLQGLRPFGGLPDVIAAVERTRPDAVLLFSAYLFVKDGLCSGDGLAQLLDGLRSRGVKVGTSDPFLGFWPRRPRAGRAGRIVAHFNEMAARLQAVTHIYPLPLPAGGEGPGLSYRNPRALGGIGGPADRRLLAPLGLTPAVPFWLFYLSAAEFAARCRPGRCRLLKIIPELLRRAAGAGAVPVLVAPEACIERVGAAGVAGQGAILLPPLACPTYFALLQAAEFVFSWNVFSFSLMGRVLGRRPVFFLAKGHLSDFDHAFFAHAARYFPGCRISVVGPGSIPPPGELRRAAAGQRRGLFDPFAAALEALAEPPQLLDGLRA